MLKSVPVLCTREGMPDISFTTAKKEEKEKKKKQVYSTACWIQIQLVSWINVFMQ